MSLLRPQIRSARGGAAPLNDAPAGAPIRKGDHLYLVDGSGYLFRAYHALPPLTRKSDGMPTGAVSGFSNMLWKLLEDTKAGDKPTHLAVIFDAGRKSFRNDMFEDYKANRSEPPDDLIPQFPLTRDAVRAFGVACVEKRGYEADDLIATYARIAREAGVRVTIVSADKDLMQVVRDGQVEMLDTVKNRRISSEQVIERFGVPPERVIDVQALVGDSIDNVPGVPGIGIKTAAKLIAEFGSLETLLSRANEVKQPKCREALVEYEGKARLSARLVTLDDHVPLDHEIEEFAVREPDPTQLLPFLRSLEFMNLLRRAGAKLGVDEAELGSIPAAPGTAARPAAPISVESKGCPGAVSERDAILLPIQYGNYVLITDAEAFDRWLASIPESGVLALSVQTDSSDGMRAGIIGIALCVAPGTACYIALSPRNNGELNLQGSGPRHLE